MQPGQAVIDEIGVVGQVTRVFPYMAEVTLVTDKDHAVPVKVERSGVRSVMYGAGTARLPELRFLSPNAEIQPGDRLVTSGIDGTYPAGLAVAQVVSVERETGQIFARVTCKPLAGVDSSAHLLILEPPPRCPPRPEEPAEADAPRKGRGKAQRRLMHDGATASASLAARPEEILLPVEAVVHRAHPVHAAWWATLLPLSGIALALKPDFLALVLLYWCIQEPR